MTKSPDSVTSIFYIFFTETETDGLDNDTWMYNQDQFHQTQRTLDDAEIPEVME